jgi:long-chain fatty acid transport protein
MRAWHIVARGGLVAFVSLLASQARAQPGSIYSDDEYGPPQIRLDLSLGSGARALGMGGAFLARADDASAASWNPAGLSYLRYPEISVAGINTRANTDGFTPEAEGATLGYSDRLKAKNLDFVAVAYPFALGSVSGVGQINWQRAIALGGTRKINRTTGGDVDTDLGTDKGLDVFAASVGMQVTRKTRVGLSVNHWTDGYDSYANRTRVVGDRVEQVKHVTGFRVNGWNANGGVIWTPWEDRSGRSLNLGAVAKSGFTGNVTLERERTDFPGRFITDPEPVVTPAPLKDSSDNLELDFPAAFGLGASWRVASPFTVSLDVTRTFWSHARIRNYYDLSATKGRTDYPLPLAFPSLGRPQKDTEQIRMGLEYVRFVKRVQIPVRVGYFSDRQYFTVPNGCVAEISEVENEDEIDDGLTPCTAPRFNAFTMGTGISVGNILFDIAYLREYGRYLDGLDEKVRSRRIFVSLIYRFGSN